MCLEQVEVPAISKHLADIFESDELIQEANVSILEIVQQEGIRNVTRKVKYYNPPVVFIPPAVHQLFLVS